MALSLEKKRELVGLQLAKRNVPDNIIMQVKSAMDVSGSFKNFFTNGTIQELFNRLIPVAMRFDDNGSLESFAFSDQACSVPDIKPEDFDSYVNDKFLPAVPRNILWSGTDYSTALKLILEDVTGKKSGFFGGMFSKTKSLYPPTYVLFTTDGDTSDKSAAEAELKKFADKKTYVQLIGVGRGSDFDFLKRMADKYDYVGFVTFPDLANTSDQKLYEELISDELCTWIKAQ